MSPWHGVVARRAQTLSPQRHLDRPRLKVIESRSLNRQGAKTPVGSSQSFLISEVPEIRAIEPRFVPKNIPICLASWSPGDSISEATPSIQLEVGLH